MALTMRSADRAQRLIDIGSTTAISALVEIVSGERRDAGILGRQAQALLERYRGEEGRHALQGFCDELQSLIESVPGARVPAKRSGKPSRRESRP